MKLHPQTPWLGVTLLLLGACFSSWDPSIWACGYHPKSTLIADAGLVTMVSQPGQQLRVEVQGRAARSGGTLKYSVAYESFGTCPGQDNCGGFTDLPRVIPFDYTGVDGLHDGGLFSRSCDDAEVCEGRKFIDFFDRRLDGGLGYIQFFYGLELIVNEGPDALEKTPTTLDLQLRFFDAGFAPGFGPLTPDSAGDAGP